MILSILVAAGLRKCQNHRETQKSAAWRQKEYGWFGKPSSVCLQNCGLQSKSVKRKTGP
jgi:hypothetical protein